ncbi:uncharacterized protein A4U43_C05F21370 [Asparagus officinalis]|uniref:2-oxoadipate dioxygenase/decarboxylase n=1 Tax=Asparagus officinalis TaxID=4686 RepID=A0A5P1ETK0_ASPOF|nr:uncharacterized protein A4U43_C05F21370 [Asparagus officinalis]
MVRSLDSDLRQLYKWTSISPSKNDGVPATPEDPSKRKFRYVPGSQSQSFFRSALSSMEKVYLTRNPTAKSVLESVSSSDGSPVCYDHFAFRTFGVDGHGIDSIASFFLDFGYTQRDELRFFQRKKLRALWFAAPETEYSNKCSLPLPRIFISELLVDELNSQSQEIIRKYVKISGILVLKVFVTEANDHDVVLTW